MVAEKVYRTVEVFSPDLVSGVRSADATGDYNHIHRSDEAAVRLGGKLGIERAVAAGMGVISRAQGDKRIRSAKFKFKDLIYYGQHVAMQKEIDGNGYRFIEHHFIDGSESKGNPRIFYEGEIVLGDSSGDIINEPSTGLKYNENAHVSKKDIRNYLDAAAKDFNLIGEPDLFLMSLPAAAMVNHARNNNKGGLHNLQSIEIHRPWEPGDIKVSLFQKKLRMGSAFQKYQVYWSQKGLVVASGEAIAASFDL